jgi:fructose-1-phosphate kinase PfkB-like protein
MIVTVTANPSIDRTIELAAPLRRGEVQVVAGMREQAGGKGVNVARALHAADVDVLAVVPCDAADPLLAEIAGLGVSVSNVPTGAPVRTNITLSEPDGTTTKLNAAGESLLPELGVGSMLLTLGAAGALLVTRDGSWAARPPRITPRSTVGAGDSSLAGYLVSVHAGRPPAHALGLAVAYGAAAASLAGSTVPRPDQTRADLVEVTSLPRIAAG